MNHFPLFKVANSEKAEGHGPLCFAVLCYVGALIWVYKHNLSPAFSYMGLYDKPLDLTYSLFAGLLIIVPISWMPKELSSPSQIVLWLLYLLAVIPSCVIPYFVVETAWSDQFFWISTVVFSFWLVYYCSRLSFISPVKIIIATHSFWVIVFFISFLSYYLIISVFGLKLTIIKLADVYSVRDAYKAELFESGRGVAYALLWQANVLNPLFIIQGLSKRIPLLLITGVVGQLFLFSVTGFKSILFGVPILLISLLIILYGRRRFGLVVVWGMTLVILVCALLDLKSNSTIFSGILVRRLIVTPGQLSAYYFEFFSTHPFYYLQHSIFGAFVEKTYAETPAITIGQAYFIQGDMSNPTNANANLWADAYANFGFIGMLIYTAVLGFIMQFLDKIAVRKDFVLSSLLMIMPAISLCNSSLFTTLITHGMGLVILLLYLLPEASATTASQHLLNVKQKGKIVT